MPILRRKGRPSAPEAKSVDTVPAGSFPADFELAPGELTARAYSHEISSFRGLVPCWPGLPPLPLPTVVGREPLQRGVEGRDGSHRPLEIDALPYTEGHGSEGRGESLPASLSRRGSRAPREAVGGSG